MSAVARPGVGTAIACVLLPPLGVWLLAGVGRDFWVAIGLTCLFFLPGIAWALVVLVRGGVTSVAPHKARPAGDSAVRS